MKNKLRVGDYLARKKTHQGDNGERFEVISISEDSVRVLNLKNHLIDYRSKIKGENSLSVYPHWAIVMKY